jgi:hypothetical protein
LKCYRPTDARHMCESGRRRDAAWRFRRPKRGVRESSPDCETAKR